ncbi:MAG: CRISPR-associated endonuclease Cas1 [Candidatus Aminicenantales bacterium]
MAVLYLIEQGSLLRKESKRLVVEKEGKILLEVPEFKIERVIIIGNVQLTTQAMKFLLQSGIETAFMTTRGKLIGKLTPVETKNVELRMLQYQKYHDEKFRLSMAKCIVEGKIKNSKVLLQKYQRNHPEVNFGASIRELNELLLGLSRKEKVSSVFGLEGRASAAYFSCFGRMFRKELQFETRTKHPPLDPVNALLSLGYTLITNEILSVVSSIGYDPYIGFLHGIEYGRPSLALDLVEEFRAPIIDRLTLEIINKGIITSGDFEKKEKGYFLKDSSRERFFKQYEKRMQESFFIPEEKAEGNYRRIFFYQAQKFAKSLRSGSLYRPFAIR